MEPDPRRIVTRRDMANELTSLREYAGRTVRELAKDIGVPFSTAGDYFSGAHLPKASTLIAILTALGISDPTTVDQWQAALVRVRSGPGDLTTPSSTVYAPQPSVATAAWNPPSESVMRSALVSTRPPFDRLSSTPPLRGRDDLLDRLTPTDDHAPDRPCAYVLHGLGGVGKSSVALSIAQRATDQGFQTWWISGSDAAAWSAGIQALAIELGTDPVALRLGSPPDLVWRRLEEWPRPWVLVFDAVDDPQDLLNVANGQIRDGNGWLRRVTRPGMVIVTTRDGSPATWGDPPPPWLELLSVTALSPAEGAGVLRDIASDAGTDDDAVRLADRLGGLPLGLTLTGRYLAESARLPKNFASTDVVRDFAEYQRALDSGRFRELFDSSPERDERRVLGTTWELSLNLLAAQGMPAARPLLRLLACFEATPVPQLMLSPAVMARSPLFADVDGRLVWRMLNALRDLGLVQFDEDGLIRLHPLVRAAARSHPETRAQAVTYLALVTDLLSYASSALDPNEPANWSVWRTLADHCECPLNLIRDHGITPSQIAPGVVRVATEGARYLRASGQLARAEVSQRRALRIGRDVVGTEHLDVLALQHDHSRVWYDLGRLADAEREFQIVLKARTAVLGPRHPDTLTTSHFLARCLRDEGRLDRAERLFRDTLAIRLQVLGPTHPDTLTSRSNLGDTMRARGMLDDAQVELDLAHAQRVALLGPRHPTTLVSVHHLAKLAHDQGRLDAAHDQLRSLVEAAEETMGENHPRTLTYTQSLADVLHSLGRLDEAELLSRKVLQERLRQLGPNHPATMVTRHRLALILVDRGQLAAAEAELREVLALRRLVLGQRHPDTQRTRQTVEALRLRS